MTGTAEAGQCAATPGADRAAHAGAAETAIAHRILGEVLLMVVLGEIERRRVEDLGRDRRRSPSALSAFSYIALRGLGGLRAAPARTRRCRSGTACRRRCPGACPGSGRGFPRTSSAAARRRSSSGRRPPAPPRCGRCGRCRPPRRSGWASAPAGVADRGDVDAVAELPELALGAPEAAHAEHRRLEPLGIRPLQRRAG